jgi:hypothetical protein
MRRALDPRHDISILWRHLRETPATSPRLYGLLDPIHVAPVKEHFASLTTHNTRTVPPGFLWRAACRTGPSCIERVSARATLAYCGACSANPNLHDVLLSGSTNIFAPLVLAFAHHSVMPLTSDVQLLCCSARYNHTCAT